MVAASTQPSQHAPSASPVPRALGWGKWVLNTLGGSDRWWYYLTLRL